MTGEAPSFDQIDGYVERLLQLDDPQLADALADARAAGLPAIEVSPVQGRLLTVLALGSTVVILGRRGSRLDLALLMGIGCVGTLVVSPVSRGHYFVMLGPILLFVPVWLRTVGYRGVADLTPFIPAAACLAHYLGLEFTGRIGLLGMTTSFWLWAVLARVLAARTSVPTTALRIVDEPATIARAT